MTKTYQEVERLKKNPHYKMSEAEKQALESGKKSTEETNPQVEQAEPVRKNKNRVVREKGDVKKHTTTTLEEN